MRWEHTEPLASSPKALRIAEVARQVMERAPTQPVAMPPGAVRQPPTAAMVAMPGPGDATGLAGTAYMAPSPLPAPSRNKLAATAPLDPNAPIMSPFQVGGAPRQPGQRPSTPALAPAPKKSSAPIVVLVVGLLLLAAIAVGWGLYMFVPRGPAGAAPLPGAELGTRVTACQV
jgi:hypothetical protein